MSEKHRNFYHYHSNFVSAGDSNEDASNRGVHEIPIPGGISDLLFGNIMKVSGSDWKHETTFDEVMYETTFRFYKTRLSKINTLLFTKSIDAGTLSCEASGTKTDATESSSVKPKSNLIYVSTSATTDEVTLKSTKTERLEEIVRSLINGKGQSSSVHSAKPQKQLKPNIRGGTIRIQQERVPSFFHLDQKLSESGLDFTLDPERSSLQSETEVQCDDEEHSLVSVAETFIVQKSSDYPVETIFSGDQTGKNFPEYRSDVCSYEFGFDNVPFEVQDDEFATHVQDQQCRLQSDICTSHTDEIDTILRESCQSESQSEKLCSESQIVYEEHITNGRTEIGPTAKHFSGSQSKEHLSGSLTEVSLPCASTEDYLDSEAEKLHPDDITSNERLVESPIQQQDVSMKEQCFLRCTGEKGPSDVSTKVCLSDFSNEDYCSNVLNVEHTSDAPAVGHVSGSHAEECLSDFPGETFCEERSCLDLNNQSLLHASEKGSLSGSHSEKHFPEATTNDHRPQSPDELILDNSNYQNNSENQTKSTAPDFQLKEVTQTQIERLEVKIIGNETFISETEMPRDLSQALVEISDTKIEGGCPKVQTELLKAHSFSSGSEGQECQLQITKVQNEEYISETQTKSSLSEFGFEEFPTDVPNVTEVPPETSTSETCQSAKAQAEETLLKVPCETSIFQAAQFSEAQAKENLSEVPCEPSISQAGQYSESQAEENLLETPCETSVSKVAQYSESQVKVSYLELPCEISKSQDAQSTEDHAKASFLKDPSETSVSEATQSSEAQAKRSLLETPCEISKSQAGQSPEPQAEGSPSELPRGSSVSQAAQSFEGQTKESLSEIPCETSIAQSAQSSAARDKDNLSEVPCEPLITQAWQYSETQAKESHFEAPCETSISQVDQSSDFQFKESLSELPRETLVSQTGQSPEAQTKESLLETPCETSVSQSAHSCEAQAKESLSEVPCETLISQSSEVQAKESLSTVPCEPSISQAEQYSECQAKVSVLEAPCETSVSQVGQSSDAQIKVSSLEFSCEISKSQGAQSTGIQNKESILQNSCGISISPAGKSSEAQVEESVSELPRETSVSRAGQSSIVQAKESLLELTCETSVSPGTNDSTAHPNGKKERIPDDPERKSCLEKTEMFSKIISSTSEAVLAKQLAFEDCWRTLVLNKDCPEMTDKGHSTGGQVNVSSLVKASHELSKLTSLEAKSSSRQTMSSKESTDPWNDSEDSDEEDAPGNLWEVHHSGTETLAYCAGDKIGELEPFAYVLREDTIMSRCSYCFESVDSSTKTVCSKCYYAVYCDMNCQDRHLETHIRECSWLRRVHGTKFPDIHIRLTALVLSKLKDRSSHNISYGFIDKTYCYEDLPPDMDTIPKDILKPRGKRFWDILHYQFQSFVNDSSIRFDEFRKAYYKVTRNSMFISTNPYDEIGRGVYFGMAGIHTSCYPNSNVSYTGTTAHIVATCDIDFADRNRITIRQSFDMGPRADRQAAIKLLIWKLCDCKLCQSDEFEAAVTKVKDGEKSSAIMNYVETILTQLGDKNNYRYDEEELKIASLCLKAVDRVAGPYHHARLTIMPIFAGCLAKLGRHEEAISAFKKLLRIYRHVYGPNNYYTLNTLQNMVFIYQKMCRRRKARKYSAKAVQIAYFIYGYEHPIFKHIRYNFILSEKSSHVNEQS